MSGRVIRMPLRPGVEPWLSKKQLAAHLGYSTRWVELRGRTAPLPRLGGRALAEGEVRVIVPRSGSYGVTVYDPALKRKRWVGTFKTLTITVYFRKINA